MKKNIYLTLLLVFCYNICNSQSVKSNFVIKTQEEAYSKVIEYTGFNSKNYSYKALSENNSIKLKLLEEENLSFVDDSIIGKEVWMVKFENVSLNLSPGWVQSYQDNQIKKNITVVVEAESGKLIKIIAQSDTTKSFFYDNISKDYLKKKLNGCGEQWLGFPDTVPNISYEKALQAAVPSNPFMAEEIHAVCVYQKDLNNESRLVWMITGNNIPEDFMLGKKVRSIIDAKTGKILGAMTYP